MGATRKWHAMEASAALRQLQVDPGHGLGSAEIARRQDEYGANIIATRSRSTWPRLVANQFRDFMILVLIAAAIVSGVVGEPGDAIAIIVIVVLNAAVGIFQEYRAERALEALRSLVVPTTWVRRNGSTLTVESSSLVPGDIVILHSGSAVPADLRLIESQQIAADESALTGESETVAKRTAPLADTDLALGDQSNIMFHGSLVARGRGEGVVFATGSRTELGQIAALLRDVPISRTPLQQRLARFGRRLALIVLGICALIFGLGLLRGEPVVLMFLTAVSLAVAAIPEALPAVVTVSLALGARKMSKARALMRRLPAVETLGSVTYICADKTGTLTRNKMQVETVATGRYTHSEIDMALAEKSPLLGLAMALSNDVARDVTGSATGDPTELALYEFAMQSGFDKHELLINFPRRREEPFHTTTKRMITVHDGPEKPVAFLKGAPEAVLPLCRPTENSILEQAEGLAHEGYRVLAIAAKALQHIDDAIDSDFVFCGLAALTDPPRSGVQQAVATCRTAGIRPVMITGDHPGTALAIARRVGIAAEDDRAVTGTRLEAMSDSEFAKCVRSTRVYARVDPAQKIRIVEALQDQGEFVAMTGDGVNDAPALRRANIGVAMGGKGTDAAREAADMVILDDNFATIVRAVREGRRIFDNILKFIRYTMTSNAGEIFTMLMAPFFGLPIPLLPIHILWINLVTDGLPGLALATEPVEKDAMNRPPRPPEQRIFTGSMLQRIFWIGLLIGGLSIAGQWWAYHGGSQNWQTIVFTVLTFSQLVNVLMIRLESDSVFGKQFFTNRALLAAVGLTVMAQLVVIYWPPLQAIFDTAPLTAFELLVCVVLSATVLVVAETDKLLRRSTRKRLAGD